MIARTGVGPGGRPLVGAGLRAAQLQEDEQYLFKGTGAEQVPSVELVSPAILFHGRECHVAPTSPSQHPLGDSAFFRLAFMPTFSACRFQWIEDCRGGWRGNRRRWQRGSPVLEAICPAPTGPLVTLQCCSHLPPRVHFLPSWAPGLAASLLPVVYFLFCHSEEEVGGKYPWPPNPTSFVSSTLRDGKGVLQGRSH